MITMNRTDALAARGLVKAFGEHRVLDRFDASFAAGSATALTGPNGSGKSTLLRCLAGAAPIDAGDVLLDGDVCDTSAPDHWRAVLSILDDHAWLPGLTVRDHLLLVGDDVDHALDRVGLTGLGDRRAESLSSGQRQRAALAITLVRPWRVLLLDEPERHLDAAGIDLLVDLAAQWGDRTLVFATHSEDLVRRTGAARVPMGT